MTGSDGVQEINFFGSTIHFAWDMGEDNGFALYAAPAWTVDHNGIASSSLSITGSMGHEPSEGWSRDINAAVNYIDQSSFSAVTSPEVNNLWTGTMLASLGRAWGQHSSYSVEGFASYSSGDLPPGAGFPATGSAWRLGGGAGYQRNFGKDPIGLAWAVYGGSQCEWADVGTGQKPFSPSFVVNFSVGMIRRR